MKNSIKKIEELDISNDRFYYAKKENLIQEKNEEIEGIEMFFKKKESVNLFLQCQIQSRIKLKIVKILEKIKC